MLVVLQDINVFYQKSLSPILIKKIPNRVFFKQRLLKFHIKQSYPY